MKIIFFGSDDFAEAHLRALIGSEHEVCAAVTRPDRPKGRGMKVVVSPIKERAQDYDIPVLQPVSLKEVSFLKDLTAFKSDLFVVIAYGKFLPAEVLNIPPHGAVNVHASLVPKYRGAGPINWAIINGEKETGISVIKMNEEMDAGDILAQKKIDIETGETAVTLRDKMIKEGPPFLLEVIDGFSGYVGKPQDKNQVTFAPKLTKELGHIAWTKSAVEIYNLIHGLMPWPSAYTFFNGKLLKILAADVIDEDVPEDEPGTVVGVNKSGIIVATGKNRLMIRKVHLQDSKPMGAHQFVIGHALEVGGTFK